MESGAKVGDLGKGVSLRIAANDQQSARNVANAIVRLCGGQSTISSPEEMAERLRRAALRLENKVPLDLSGADLRWEVLWNSDHTVSVLDRWQCEGWAPKLHELITVHGCELRGWSLNRKDITKS